MDTGNQLLTVPVSILSFHGAREQDPLPVATNLNTVTGKPLDIIGGILLVFTGTNPTTGAVRCTRQLAYVSRSVPYPFLSREACADLGVIPASFPAIGSCYAGKSATVSASNQPTLCTYTGVSSPGDLLCSCLSRQAPPSSPPTLSCLPNQENLP